MISIMILLDYFLSLLIFILNTVTIFYAHIDNTHKQLHNRENQQLQDHF